MNNTFLLFYSPKPRNQVRILINRKWSSGFVNHGEQKRLKVARYSFSRPIPSKFEHKLRRHKQNFGKIAPTVVLDKDENLL